MKLQIFLLSFLLIGILSCKDKDDNLPNCVDTEVNAFSKSPDICPNTAEVVEYRFEGESVYLFDPGNCIADAGFRVIDESCVERCLLGTIVGVTDCEGKNFYDLAEKVRVVWSNEN